jgi:hypothetical protein
VPWLIQVQNGVIDVMMRRRGSDMVGHNFVIRARRRLHVLFLALFHSVARLTAQDSFTSYSVLDQSISFAQEREPDLKDNASNDQAEDLKPQYESTRLYSICLGKSHLHR